jgi:hypothetical protein
LDLTTHTSLYGFANYKKECTRFAVACDNRLTVACSTNKTGRHDIAEILLNVALKHQQSNPFNNLYKQNNDSLPNVENGVCNSYHQSPDRELFKGLSRDHVLHGRVTGQRGSQIPHIHRQYGHV